jgi:acetyltransferase-like isoleucine patch superfamily enzyme
MALLETRPRSGLGPIYEEICKAAMIMRRVYLRRLWGMDIAPSCMISMSANLGKDHPWGIHIGADTVVQFGSYVLTYDQICGRAVDTWIGKNCQIGARSIVFPGVKIGDNCVVTAGSVVIDDVPANCVVAGNPARVIERGIKTGRWGVIDRVVQGKFARSSPTVEGEPESRLKS